mmetsp:Transcript_10771/g.14668  ORF Transcript_10771/g.14668 Transcript_10771/m.14668 type:complete len:1045 (+) Transcript_10771:197-3331(+)|eukprot:CAMPEP_0196579134 /NCGR_PEP_ID=MMETSP1081-20130531/17667_1 /TAXON_ID=36882 /ORGANISM="Pyramimonas amylifera, Strain CCMP720" /LENGTH=1044 /DNA_ID=CAMNT_0041898605 /DNA_START=191 /DNA_END=3325 /DNA_ORIENTATION=-
MGCVISLCASSPVKESASAVNGKGITDSSGATLGAMKGTGAAFTGPVVTGGPLSQKEYNTRIVSSMSVQNVRVPDEQYSMNYAYVSQRGYYPESLDKANQDAFCVHTNFGADPNCHFFGVFDGHGEYGTQCAQFARDRVVQNLLKDSNFATDPKKVYHKAFVDANNQLHRHHIDDSMSGTTGIAVVIRNRQMCVANVGDSRATCAVRHGKKLVAVDLSHDQTPFRNDECERVKKYGARVLTLDQLEGLKDPDVQCWGNEEDDDGDPPRLWTQTGMYPGTAFTRSLGDAAAEKIGVIAEPECMSKEITADIAFIVIASDGVFEFLSSQTVIEMVNKFDDVQEAANAICAESYRLWLQYETRTDDITVIIIRLQGLDKPGVPLGSSRKNLLANVNDNTVRVTGHEAAVSAGMNRPVRRAVSKQKRAAIQAMLESEQDEEPYVLPDNLPKKTPEQLKHIEETVKANFLFAHLNEHQRSTIFEAMEMEEVTAGQVVIQQGDKGENFFIIEKGEFDVFVQHGAGEAELVHTYTTAGGTHASFGELSLMYGKPRAATVKAKTGGSLWKLDRRAFRSILHKQDNKGMIKVLRSVEVLQSLNIGQLQRLADTLAEEVFEDGHHIIQQGDVGNEFFIINKGHVVCTVRKNPANTAEAAKEVLRLGPNQYFGERALLGNAKRAANVIAKGRVRCLSISRDVFEEVLGPLQTIINSDRKWRERSVQHKEQAARKPMANLHNLSRGHLDVTDVLYKTEICQVSRVQHKQSKENLLLKTWGLKKVEEAKRQTQVMKEHNIQLGLSPAPPIIPNVVKTFKDDVSVSLLMHSTIVCSFDAVLQEPLSEGAASFYAASLVLALEHLHNENVVYRSWNPEAILVDDDGHLALVDFQFSKQLDGPTYTLCGNPEYLAPEMVENKGHTQAVDLWALGILIYYMLSGETPFASADDSEIKIYSKITARQITYPDNFSASANDLIDKLLARDPNKRLGYVGGGITALKKHSWFKNVDWDALSSYMRDTVPAPGEMQARLKNLEPSDLKSEIWEPYSGDRNWFKDF